MPGVGPNFYLELRNADDFGRISRNGLVSICGFGSLLSEKSARFTCPKLQNFKLGLVHDFRRIFAHVAPVFLERGIVNMQTKEMASLSAEKCNGEVIVVTTFDISLDEVPSFIEREDEFEFLALNVEALDGSEANKPSVICTVSNDEYYLHVRCKGNPNIFHQRYGRYGFDKIWRDDILPCRLYLRHCVLAARGLGQIALDSFLDHTYLGDRKTTIREYLEKNPDIMKEEPPPHLFQRYGG